ncbi:hypothetical protein RJT34_11815 [Clitoria ternatea]|uniref:Uncharacterized protein n=1 Tax=Clitoria ternatea TaxID=43366 RepID=A0AAN9PKU0_CLITE
MAGCEADSREHRGCFVIQHSIDSMETKPPKYNFETGAIMDLTDWRHLGFMEKVDFGWGEPVNMILAPCNNMVGLCIILPSTLKEGGVRVYVCLPPPAMPIFKQDTQALNKPDENKPHVFEAQKHKGGDVSRPKMFLKRKTLLCV